MGMKSRFERPVLNQLFSPRREPTITDPAFAIKREVLQLVDLQIETLTGEPSLNLSHLED
jgi:hypothetical protein